MPAVISVADLTDCVVRASTVQMSNDHTAGNKRLQDL